MVLASLPPDDAAQTLVDLANLLGGPDNITVDRGRGRRSAQLVAAGATARRPRPSRRRLAAQRRDVDEQVIGRRRAPQ